MYINFVALEEECLRGASIVSSYVAVGCSAKCSFNMVISEPARAGVFPYSARNNDDDDEELFLFISRLSGLIAAEKRRRCERLSAMRYVNISVNFCVLWKLPVCLYKLRDVFICNFTSARIKSIFMCTNGIDCLSATECSIAV